MMQGIVTADREAVLTLTVLGAGVQWTDIDTVLDTGFTDFLTLPLADINVLSLPLTGTTIVTLADGSRSRLGVFQATVLWHGQPRLIDILAADGGSLLGMSLLYGSRRHMDIVDSAAFTVEPLP